jgi:hypothetical protein
MKTIRRRRAATALVLTSLAAGLGSAQADDSTSAQEAKRLFKAMSDHVSSQTAISFNYESDIEIITSDLQKLTFASSGAATISRPDKIRMTRTGGFTDVELSYDGKILAIHGKKLNAFVKHPMTGNLDEVIDTLRSDLGLDAPAADLLASNPDEAMMANVTDAKDLGSGVIGGVECDHLAFRTPDTDWQIWITQGSKPRPCRFTITSKTLALAPEYSIEVTEWKEGTDVVADDFSLKADAGATEVNWDQLGGLGDVPHVLVKGSGQ